MKLHVSAYNGDHQVSTTIKKSLYTCVGAYAPTQIYRLFLIVVETWWWPLQAETCSFIIRIKHLSKQVVLIDYTFLPLISYTHNGDDTP